MNIQSEIPKTEPQRQFYYIDRTRELVDGIKQQTGQAPTFHVTTFGCQMNARDSEKLRGIFISTGFSEIEEEIHMGIADIDLRYDLRFLHHAAANADHKVRIRLFQRL